MADPEMPSGRFSSATGARITALPRKVAMATTMSMIMIGQIMYERTGSAMTMTQATATAPNEIAIILVDDLNT